MALQVITSFGNVAPGQLWTPTFVQELFENAAYAVVGSVSGSTILSAGSVLNTHQADDAVDARVWKDTENAFVCAGLTVNGTLTLTTGSVTGALTVAGTTLLNGSVALGSDSADIVDCAARMRNWWFSQTAVASVSATDLLGVEQGGYVKKATMEQVRSAARPRLVVADDTAGGQTPGAAAWHTRNVTALTTNEAGASLAAHVITLPAGFYRVRVLAGHNNCYGPLLRVATVAGTVLVAGVPSGYNATLDSYAPGVSHLEGFFTLATSDQVRIQHYITNVGASPTLGTVNALAGGTQYVMRAIFERWEA